VLRGALVSLTPPADETLMVGKYWHEDLHTTCQSRGRLSLARAGACRKAWCRRALRRIGDRASAGWA